MVLKKWRWSSWSSEELWPAARVNRWGLWVTAVLSRCSDSRFLGSQRSSPEHWSSQTEATCHKQFTEQVCTAKLFLSGPSSSLSVLHLSRAPPSFLPHHYNSSLTICHFFFLPSVQSPSETPLPHLVLLLLILIPDHFRMLLLFIFNVATDMRMTSSKGSQQCM